MPAIDNTGVSAIIPESVATTIISGVEQTSVAMRLMRKARMTTKQHRMPVLASLPAAYFVAGGGGLKKTTKAAWANKYLIAEEIAVIVPIPEEYIDDSAFDIWGEIKPKIAEAFAEKLDGAVLFGIDKPDTWGTDVYHHAVAAGNEVTRGAVADQDLAGDISDAMALVTADGFRSTGHVADATLEADLRNMRDLNNQPIFAPSVAANAFDTVWGRPLAWAMPGAWDLDLADLLTGDWTNGIIATRQDLTYRMLTEATLHDEDGEVLYNLAQQDMVALRCTMRLAYQIANAVNRRGDPANQSPFAVLHPEA